MANKLQTPQGQIMSLDQALDMEDLHGEPLKWNEVEGKPGSYVATVERKGVKTNKDKSTPGRKYTYSIDPYSPTGKPVVLVSMYKEIVKPKKEAIEAAEKGQTPVVVEETGSHSVAEPSESSTETEEEEESESETEEETEGKRSYRRRS